MTLYWKLEVDCPKWRGGAGRATGEKVKSGTLGPGGPSRKVRRGREIGSFVVFVRAFIQVAFSPILVLEVVHSLSAVVIKRRNDGMSAVSHTFRH